MKEKILGLVFIFTAGAVGWLALHIEDTPTTPMATNNPQTQKRDLVQILSSNVQELGEQGLLPKEWGDIRSVIYNVHSERIQELLGEQRMRIRENPEGHFRLEVDLIDTGDQEAPEVIMQLSLFELERNNKFWEHSRNISFKELIQRHPETKKPDEVSSVGSK